MTLPPLLIAAENGDVLFYSGVCRRTPMRSVLLC